MHELNVIVIEEQDELFEDQREKYRKFFNYCGYSIEAFHATGQSGAQKLIRSKGGKDRIHVLISDIFTSGPKRGLLWIQRLKEEFPDIFYIGNSRHDITYRDTAVRWPTFDIYIDKNLLNRETDEEFAPLREQFLSNFSQDVDVYISDKSDLSNLHNMDFKNKHLDRGLNSLVGQILFSKGINDSFIHPTEVILTPITGGFSGSYVFKLEAVCGKSKLKTVPAVLKISKGENARYEADNYKKFVKWILPYSWRVDLLGEGEIKKWTAVCYSFVHSSGMEFDSVTGALIKGDVNSIKKVIDSMFSPNYQTWYSEKLCENSGDAQISSHYSNEYFGKNTLNESQQIFLGLSQRLLGADTSHRGEVSVASLGASIKEPSTELFSLGRGSFTTTISHGDLNSNNILISGNELTFIDFQSCGRKHVFNDFLTFEGSIRLHFGAPEVDPKAMIKYEGMISSLDLVEGRLNSDPDLPEMYKLILRVRRAAIRNFPNEPFSNYLYGTTVYSFRLLRVDDFHDLQYKRLLCQIFSGMSRL